MYSLTLSDWQSLDQSLDGGVVLVAFLHGDDVGEGLGGLGISVLGEPGHRRRGSYRPSMAKLELMTDRSTSLARLGIIAASSSLNCRFLGLPAMSLGVAFRPASVLQLDQSALGGQQLEGASLVGGVVGHGDGGAVGQLFQGLGDRPG